MTEPSRRATLDGMTYLMSCAHCACPVRSGEAACPHCGGIVAPAGVRSMPLAAAAIVLGLTAAAGAAGCSTPVYGVAGTNDPGPTGGSGGSSEVGGAGGEGGAAIGGAGGESIGGAGGQGGGAAPLYGIAGTGGSGGGKL